MGGVRFVARRTVRLATAVLAAGGLSVASWGLSAGTAQAYTYDKSVCNEHACSYVWCPGMPLPRPDAGPPDWDMNVCHHFMIGKMYDKYPWTTNGGANRQVSPWVIEGDPGP
jgi:hypothetical protein